MRYRAEKVLVSTGGEIFKIGDFVTVTYSPWLLCKKSVFGKICKTEAGMHGTLVGIDISKDFDSDIQYVLISEISDIQKQTQEE